MGIIKHEALFDISYHACHIDEMNALQISIRELHSHTGRYVEKASSDRRIIITHRGKPVAEIKPYSQQENPEINRWSNRYLTPEFRKLQKAGAFKITAKTGNSTDWISEERDREIQ